MYVNIFLLLRSKNESKGWRAIYPQYKEPSFMIHWPTKKEEPNSQTIQFWSCSKNFATFELTKSTFLLHLFYYAWKYSKHLAKRNQFWRLMCWDFIGPLERYNVKSRQNVATLWLRKRIFSALQGSPVKIWLLSYLNTINTCLVLFIFRSFLFSV